MAKPDAIVSVHRRVLSFPLSRLAITLALFFALWKVADFALSLLIGRSPGGLVGRTVIAAAAVCSLAFVGHTVERRAMSALGFPRRHALRDLGLGMLCGALLLSLTVGVMAAAGWYRIAGYFWEQPPGVAGAATMAALTFAYYGLVAVTEEVLFRGVGFRLIEETVGTWAALGLTAILFGLTHLGNQHATVWSALAVGLGPGVLFAATYILARNLWLPIGLHWTWNFFEGPVFGTAVSGARQPGLLQSVTTGPDLWTGGAFGPEAGLSMVIFCATLGAVALIAGARQKRVLPPLWLRGHDLQRGGGGTLQAPAPVLVASEAAADVSVETEAAA